ncbi:Hypothetical predicted protein [Paramuricea clavata]|uniref:Uncharacterized protein n=1 Tax=Paramuricea clavata TaxID=317549 RepID=A0A6S7HJX2_PARCT|nr:Hypothetical predicted protein [Paramuricea clavata]
MDGYFLQDEDIIGDNPGEYKSFDLVDWKVSPTTDFSLESPEFNFTPENLLDRVTKEDSTLGDSDSWFSVLNTKESWSQTKTKSLEEGYLNEQVVPDQGQRGDQLDQNTKSVPIEEIQSNFAETSKESFTKENNCSPIKISPNIIMDSALEGVRTPENSNNSMFIVDHKEQVKSEQEHFEIPPANVSFSFNPLCEEKIAEKNNIKEVISTESVNFADGESQSSPVQATLVSEDDNQSKTQNSGHSTSESVQPANVETNLTIKLEQNITEHQNCKQNSKENEIFKIRKKIFKLLTITKIPKCTMVDYKFDSSNKLPSFAQTFCADLSEEQSRKSRDIELPEVLQNVRDTKDEENENDEEMFIVLPESDSECESSDIEQDDRLDQNNESETISEESLDSKELPKIKFKLEVMEAESDTPNKTQKTQYADTPSSILAIDDELEKYLVSSIVLNDTTQSDDSHLPDLSNNIGSILKSEGLSEEHSMESVYGNLFLKPELQVDGIRTCKQEQNTDLKLTETLNNYQGNLFNAALLGGERPWQEHITQENIHTLYGNVWTRSVPSEGYLNQISSRHLTNNMFHMGDPFMNNADFKTMAGLPDEIMQTDIDPFKFTNLVPKVEVMDSSLNYGF